MTETMIQTRFKKIPKYPRYDLAKQVATQTILKYANDNIPVSLSYIANRFDDLVLRSYGWFQRNMSVSREYIVTNLTKSEDGGLLRLSDDTGKEDYLILYDESKKVGRKRFTIAHELGHYFLKHHQLIDETVISRGEITDEEYDVLEKEANYFARLLLVPLPLLPYISANWGAIDTTHLMNIFNVTYTVAKNVIRHINNLYSRGGSPINTDIVDKYRVSVNQYINIHICNNCYVEFIMENPKYCPICQNKNVKRITSKDYENYFDFERSDYMIYDGIEVDENSKAVVCPTCSNEEPSEGEFCPICGIHLVNRCTNSNCTAGNGYDDYGAFLPGNARYCTYCGTISTFFQNRLLKSWQQEKQEFELEQYKSEVAASNEIIDDDIPF